jgi:hypothetical protein
MFMNRFIDPIRAGTKRQTLRDTCRFRSGEWFSPRYWSGSPYRSRQVEIRKPLEVSRVDPVVIEFAAGEGLVVALDQSRIRDDERDDFARRDGFADHAEFAAFWRARMIRERNVSWKGFAIQWHDPGAIS